MTTMLTETHNQRLQLETDPNTDALVERQALRFLIDHTQGRLMTDGPGETDVHISPVHYRLDPATGAFVTYLPAAGEHIDAIRAGRRTILSVPSVRGPLDGERRDGDGFATVAGIWHVQAEVEPVILDEAIDLAHLPVSIAHGPEVGIVALRLFPQAIWARIR